MKHRQISLTDHDWMTLALAEAAKGVGRTRPNPPVGAVIVRDGVCLGKGYHRRAGGPHAEVAALRACREDPAGATLYVTLEPCSTQGRTPPCTDRVIEHRLARVVVASSDPNPRHRGRGLRLLRKAGIDVKTGICRPEGDRLQSWKRQWLVRPSDQDSFRHVNQARYVDYIDDTRWFAAQAGEPAGVEGPLGGLSVEYQRETHAGEQIQMETWVTGDRTRAYELTRQTDGEVLARGQVLQAES